MESSVAKGSTEVTVERLIHAPRESVWEAWTQQEKLAQWWGPKNFTNPVCQVQAKPGGKIYIEMCDNHGNRHPRLGAFRELVKPEWLVFSDSWLDEKGDALLVGLTMVDFESENGYTRITINSNVSTNTVEGFESMEGMQESWNQSLDKLEQYLRRN